MLELTLSLVSGICWTGVYIALIIHGIKDKTYGMPFVALALNLAWEALYTYTGFSGDGHGVQKWINLVWLVFDVVILITYFRYGAKSFSDHLPKKWFFPWSVLILAMAFVLQISFWVEFPKLSSWYSAFLQNLVMSILFISMLHQRKSTSGQSIVAAVLKCLGTLAPTILFGVVYGNQLVLCLGICCFVFDAIYIVQLAAQFRSLNTQAPAKAASAPS